MLAARLPACYTAVCLALPGAALMAEKIDKRASYRPHLLA